MAKKSKEKILEAATELFAETGRYGTPMEKIAEAAGVNKAMVYYYFSDRENLYRKVFKRLFEMLFQAVIPEVQSAIADEKNPIDRIKRISTAYSKNFAKNRKYIRLMLEAITGIEPDEISKIIREIQQESGFFNKSKLESEVKPGFESDTFREFDYLQFINIMISTHLGFFVTKPIFAAVTELDEESQEKFLKEREIMVPDLLLYGLVERKGTK